MSEHYATNGAVNAAARPRAYDLGESWEAPDAPGSTRSAPTLPLHVFGSLAPWIADLAAAKRAPPDYVAMSLLGSAAGVLGAAREIRIEPTWKEPPILWIALVGNPSSGKSPPLAAFVEAVQTIERSEAGDLKERQREFEQKRAEAEAIEAHWQQELKDSVKRAGNPPKRPLTADVPDEPYAPRLLAADVTREAVAWLLAKRSPRGVLLALDELMSLIGNFGKFGGRDEPFYLSAFGGRFMPVDRKTSETLTADRAYVNIIGCIQPELMQQVLSGRANDGLVSRFLCVWPEPPASWLRVAPIVDEGRAVAVLAKLRSLKMLSDDEGRPRPRELPLSAEGAEMFSDWCEEQHLKTAAASGFLQEFLGKSRGTCARLALVLELLVWAAEDGGSADGPAEVSATAMGRACLLVADYFEPMALRVFADAALPREDRDAAALLKEICARGDRQFNAREARREWGIPNLSTATAMDAAIASLVNGGCLELIERESGKRGRGSKDYLINPRLLLKARGQAL